MQNFICTGNVYDGRQPKSIKHYEVNIGLSLELMWCSQYFHLIVHTLHYFRHYKWPKSHDQKY